MHKSKKVQTALVKIGNDLSLARRKRQISMSSMAKRVGMGVSTLGRIEKGDATVAWGTVVAIFEILGELTALEKILDSAHDELGLGLMESQVPRRIRRKIINKETGAL
jgi:transcriptional regulator with XRE-family HTH domain